MTPSKTKKPLPSSTSVLPPQQPRTYDQWKAALRRVKSLFYNYQYKQCLSLCTKLLTEAKTLVREMMAALFRVHIALLYLKLTYPVQPHPLHITFLQFYKAISNEAIARSTHYMHTSKLSTLQRAKQDYEAAAASLPIPSKIDFDPAPEDISASDTESRPSTPTPCSSIRNVSVSSNSSIESCNHHLDDSFESHSVKKPSPLRIRKAVSFDDYSIAQLSCDTSTNVNPANFGPTNVQSTFTNRPTSKTFSDPSFTWIHSRSLERYNTYLEDFAEMLHSHIQAINSLIQATKEAQAANQAGRRLVSYGYSEEAKAADLKARIERLKKNGWTRKRFRPERYQELCAKALAEL